MAGALLRGLAALVLLPASGPWVSDRGDGTFRNPVLHADYSDPDVVRVGEDFYLVASSFGSVPALPVLHSRDLVNWTLVGHAADRLPSPDFDTPQHGRGLDYATLAVERTATGLAVRKARCNGADRGETETVEAGLKVEGGPVELMVVVAPNASCRFAFARADGPPRPIGEPFAARPGLWVGARVGVYAAGPGTGSADFEWFRVE